MCVSSQAGCGMNCPFCATGQGGLTRNLSTAEIVEQVVAGARRARPRRGARAARARVQRRVHGHGRAAGQLRRGGRPRCAASSTAAPEGLGHVGRGRDGVDGRPGPAHRASWPTEGLPVTLALSLHAPDDELRDTLVPVNTRWKVGEVLDAAWEYARRDRASGVDRVRADQGRQRPGVAGRPARAGCCAGTLVHVNLIPLNPTPGRSGTPSRSRRTRVRPPAAGQGVPSRCATPAAARSTAPAASWPPKAG